MHDVLPFLVFSLVSGVVSIWCKARISRPILRCVSAASGSVALAFIVYHQIDVRECDFLKGGECPPEFADTLLYDVASWSFAIWFFGMFLVFFLGGPLFALALLIEGFYRSRQVP